MVKDITAEYINLIKSFFTKKLFYRDPGEINNDNVLDILQRFNIIQKASDPFKDREKICIDVVKSSLELTENIDDLKNLVANSSICVGLLIYDDIDIIKRIISFMSDDYEQNKMIHDIFYGAFRQTAEKNNIDHLDKLIILIDNAKIKDEYIVEIYTSSICCAAEKGHLNVINRLVDLIKSTMPDKLDKILHFFHDTPINRAIQDGHLNVLNGIVDLTTDPALLKAMIDNWQIFYYAFRAASSRGHIETLDRVIELVKSICPDKLDIMIKNPLDRGAAAFKWGNREIKARIAYEINDIDIVKIHTDIYEQENKTKYNPQLLIEIGEKHQKLVKSGWSYPDIDQAKLFIKSILPLVLTCKDIYKDLSEASIGKLDLYIIKHMINCVRYADKDIKNLKNTPILEDEKKQKIYDVMKYDSTRHSSNLYQNNHDGNRFSEEDIKFMSELSFLDRLNNQTNVRAKGHKKTR